MHSLGSLAIRPRLSNETSELEQQKLALSRVKVGILDGSGGTIEDRQAGSTHPFALFTEDRG